VVALSAVTLIDSAGLAALLPTRQAAAQWISLTQRAGAGGRALALVSGRSTILRRLLWITCLEGGREEAGAPRPQTPSRPVVRGAAHAERQIGYTGIVISWLTV
jgi:hypothetical protein